VPVTPGKRRVPATVWESCSLSSAEIKKALFFTTFREKCDKKEKRDKKNNIYSCGFEKSPYICKRKQNKKQKMKATAYIYAPAASIGYESYEAGHICAESASRS